VPAVTPACVEQDTGARARWTWELPNKARATTDLTDRAGGQPHSGRLHALGGKVLCWAS
jgi:hypothetical protein